MLASTWPPLVKAGTHRPLRLATRLPEHQWMPTILTPTITRSPYEYDLTLDFKLDTPANVEVLRPSLKMPIWRTRRRLAQFANLIGQKRLFESMTNRVLINPGFFPEWTKGALIEASKAHRQSPFDVVWVTGGHWGLFDTARIIAQHLGCPLVLDYRDPWTASPDRTNDGGLKLRYQRRIEAACLAAAKAVSYVHPRCLTENEAVFGKPDNAIWATIYNGFIDMNLDVDPIGTEHPTLVHGGNCYAGRSAMPILKALNELHASERPRARFFGALDRSTLDWLKTNPTPDGFERHDLIPSHELTQHLLGAAAQLIIVGQSHAHAVPSKIFDYMQVGRPVIGIGPPHAEVKDIIETCGLGVWCDTNDINGIKMAMKLAACDQIPFNPDAQRIARYSADRMAGDTAELLNQVIA